MILFGGMSEKTRKPFSLIQQHPSAQSNPAPSTSITTPCGINLSNSGSSRSIEPIVFGVCELAVVVAIKKSAQAHSAAARALDMIGPVGDRLDGELLGQKDRSVSVAKHRRK